MYLVSIWFIKVQIKNYFVNHRNFLFVNLLIFRDILHYLVQHLSFIVF